MRDASKKIAYDVRDLGLAAEGKLNVEWANRSMPVLNSIKKRFPKRSP